LVFLGGWPFPCESAVYSDWISLDFLGFSRPNRDLSMRYAGFSAKIFSWPPSSLMADAREQEITAHNVEIRKSHAQLNLISDFLQSLVAGGALGCLNPKPSARVKT
jgi:hypothetical protein